MYRGKHKLIKQKKIIGRGSAGEVYAAAYKTKNGNIPIAIKSIPADDKEKRHQLLNDLKTFLSGAYSEYLVKFYGCYYENGLVKQIIEYMDLGSLRNVVTVISQQKIKPTEKQLATIVFKVVFKKLRS